MKNNDAKMYSEKRIIETDSLSELSKKSSEIKANMSIAFLKRSLSKYLNE